MTMARFLFRWRSQRMGTSNAIYIHRRGSRILVGGASGVLSPRVGALSLKAKNRGFSLKTPWKTAWLWRNLRGKGGPGIKAPLDPLVIHLDTSRRLARTSSLLASVAPRLNWVFFNTLIPLNCASFSRLRMPVCIVDIEPVLRFAGFRGSKAKCWLYPNTDHLK